MAHHNFRQDKEKASLNEAMMKIDIKIALPHKILRLMIHCIQILKYVTNRNKQSTEKICQMEWLLSMDEMDTKIPHYKDAINICRYNTYSRNNSPMRHSFLLMTAMPWTPLWKPGDLVVKGDDVGFACSIHWWKELCPKGQGFGGYHFFPDTHVVSESFLFAVATPTYCMFRLFCAQPLPYDLGIRILCLESLRAFRPQFLSIFRFMADRSSFNIQYSNSTSMHSPSLPYANTH
ncbi:hypothetical protein T12_16010 [Trichinella patagoniensis]|uniref:Uncharacterized protein n=1 Tax=Trichinella patagoniensis TaxID=990121 RepID=A0A0V0Z4J3_9BILA|nr:hypothetical protein T12_16010 [Trichinella patagoniensis]